MEVYLTTLNKGFDAVLDAAFTMAFSEPKKIILRKGEVDDPEEKHARRLLENLEDTIDVLHPMFGTAKQAADNHQCGPAKPRGASGGATQKPVKEVGRVSESDIQK